MARETRLAANRHSRFLPALRRQQQRGSGAHEGANEQPGAEEANVLPVDRASVGRAAWPLHGWSVIIHRGSAANVGGRGGPLVRFGLRGVWAR
jgi:hypothetical protein